MITECGAQWRRLLGCSGYNCTQRNGVSDYGAPRRTIPGNEFEAVVST